MPTSKPAWSRCGRSPDHLKVLPGLLVVVAPTHAEAERKFQDLQELLHPDLGVALLSRRLGYDLTGYPLDEPLPPLPENKVIGSRSDMITLVGEGRHHDLAPALSALRQLARPFLGDRHAGGGRRLHGALGRDRRLRRLQRAAAVF